MIKGIKISAVVIIIAAITGLISDSLNIAKHLQGIKLSGLFNWSNPFNSDQECIKYNEYSGPIKFIRETEYEATKVDGKTYKGKKNTYSIVIEIKFNTLGDIIEEKHFDFSGKCKLFYEHHYNGKEEKVNSKTFKPCDSLIEEEIFNKSRTLFERKFFSSGRIKYHAKNYYDFAGELKKIIILDHREKIIKRADYYTDTLDHFNTVVWNHYDSTGSISKKMYLNLLTLTEK
ncbi:hypothetical protein AB9P05_04410 [Roseivirga sp. BDSF3-8]|uniref:hypothetical protein n=1 Tax=Roseivirga sp. BDSF3-8 TaxID=3241598 RepID=UPI00353197BA